VDPLGASVGSPPSFRHPAVVVMGAKLVFKADGDARKQRNKCAQTPRFRRSNSGLGRADRKNSCDVGKKNATRVHSRSRWIIVPGFSCPPLEAHLRVAAANKVS